MSAIGRYGVEFRVGSQSTTVQRGSIVTFVNQMEDVVEGYQWFKNGDHPDDRCGVSTTEGTVRFLGEGRVVRRFRYPDISGKSSCKCCGNTMHVHGWIDCGGDGLTVCPGDLVFYIKDKYVVQHPKGIALVLERVNN